MAREKTVATAEKTAPVVAEPVAEAKALVPAPVPNGEIVAAVTTPPRAAPRNLCAALAQAQQKCKPVRKDAVNTFHRYRYASAEAVIAAAKEALADTGLALVPVEQSLERTPGGGYELVRKFVLLHTSGESMPLCCAWPVVEEKGRPVDKATAISATASLAYILRDLLLMPRVNAEEDMAARRDRTTPQPPAQARGVLPGAAPPAAASPPPASPVAPAAPHSLAPASAPTVRGEQIDLIDSLAAELGYSADALAKRLVKSFGQGDPKRLSAEQAERTIAGLEATKAARAEKACAAGAPEGSAGAAETKS